MLNNNQDEDKTYTLLYIFLRVTNFSGYLISRDFWSIFAKFMILFKFFKITKLCN